MGPDAMIFAFWMLSLSQLFHSPLSLSSRGYFQEQSNIPQESLLMSCVGICVVPRWWQEAWQTSAFRLSHTHHILWAFRITIFMAGLETPEFRAFPIQTPLRINLFFIVTYFWELRLWVYFSLSSCSQSWRRRWWHPALVLLPGESHGWRSLIGCSPWGQEE